MRPSITRQAIENLATTEVMEELERANDGVLDSFAEFAIELGVHEALTQEHHAFLLKLYSGTDI